MNLCKQSDFHAWPGTPVVYAGSDISGDDPSAHTLLLHVQCVDCRLEKH